MNFDFVELARRLENLIRNGTIAEADYPNARVRVKYDEDEKGEAVLTDWLPWLTTRASNDATWWAPEVGEQVLILSPSGDLALGVVLPAIYQSAHPAPLSNENKHRINYDDGSWIEYDRENHKLTATVNGGDAEVNTTGNIDATAGGNANITAGGNISADAGGSANITAAGNVTADGANVVLNGGGSGGVVCQNHVCAFTGSPHPQGSGTVSAGG